VKTICDFGTSFAIASIVTAFRELSGVVIEAQYLIVHGLVGVKGSRPYPRSLRPQQFHDNLLQF
jgi:hypothetical protein